MVGVLTLLGWAWEVHRLTDWDNDGISMFPNTAACAALSGLALLLLTARDEQKSWRVLVRVTAGVVGLVGGLTLLEHLAGVNLGIDTLLFHRSWGQRAAMAPSRMGPPASTSFLIIGTGLLLATCGPRARGFASALAILLVGIASLSLVGYCFGADYLFGVARFTGIAFQTSSVLAAIGIGLMALLPDHGLAGVLRRDDPGGLIARRLLLPSIAIPLALGWLRVRGQEAGYFDTAFGTALLALSMIAMLSALLWWTAEGVSRQARSAAAIGERLRTTLAGIGDAVIATDVERRITYMNAVAETLTGWGQGEAVGRPFDAVFNIVNEETREPVQNPAERALREGVVGLANHTVLIRKDGTERPIEDSAAPIRDGQGNVVGCVLIFRDITGRRRAEEELRRAEEQTRSVVNTVIDGIITIDERGVVQSFNPAAGRLFGYSASEVVGQNVKMLMPEPYSLEHDGYLANYLRTGEAKIISIGREVEGRRKDGSAFSMDLAVSEFSLGGRRQFTGIVRDITERKKAERLLRESESQFRQLADAMPQIVWTARPDGYLDYYNERWYEYTGFPRGEYGQSSWEPILHPDDVGRCVDTYFGCIKAERPYQIEYRFKDRRTGGYRWFLGRAVPVRDERGRIVRWFGTCTDIDDTKRAEEALQDADRRKDEFLATLAHELRNPLAPLRNALELVRRAGDRADLREQAHGLMERQLGLMVRLIDDLLDITRVTRGKLHLRKERVDLASVIRSAVEAARPSVEAQGHELTVTLPPEPVYLDADPIRLSQVFLNLLTNAAKYTEKAGRIWLTAERQGNEAVVSVRDTGIGIAAEHLPHVFTMFSQVASALERSQGGLGIGLSLVRGLVELHGGGVEAKSGGPGLGSEFVVRLPAADAPVVPAPGPGGDGEKARSGGRCRILVVDDNRDAADSLATMLGLRGHDLQTAYDGLEAVQAAAAFRPKVVLLDIGLPKMSGYDVARHIREQPWGGKIALIALTGWGQEEDRRRSLEAGLDHHLTKPVDPAALEKLLALIVPQH